MFFSIAIAVASMYHIAASELWADHRHGCSAARRCLIYITGILEMLQITSLELEYLMEDFIFNIFIQILTTSGWRWRHRRHRPRKIFSPKAIRGTSTPHEWSSRGIMEHVPLDDHYRYTMMLYVQNHGLTVPSKGTMKNVSKYIPTKNLCV